jgi:hypothetical protein
VHPGGDGGLHVGRGVADVQEILGPNAHALRDVQRGGGIGLAREPVGRAQHDLEGMAREKELDALPGELVRLVGQDRHPQAAGAGVVEQFEDPVEP